MDYRNKCGNDNFGYGREKRGTNFMTTVFITGANRGIGFELARKYADAGWRVVAGVRDVSRAKSVLDFAEVVELDVADNTSVAALKARFADDTIDVLINNAGTIGPVVQSSSDMDFNGFLDTLNINTLGPLRVTQALLPALQRSKAAKIVAITSKMGSLSYAPSDHIAYRASKAAVNKVMQCVATDLQPKGIAVAVVHPGWVRTDMGGAGADIDVGTSAAGIISVIEKLSIATSGRFWNFDGSAIAW
jgi:NAD(P)-dependent dehydrogenase (short-subunit alcohol dehydrogenase family)